MGGQNGRSAEDNSEIHRTTNRLEEWGRVLLALKNKYMPLSVKLRIITDKGKDGRVYKYYALLIDEDDAKRMGITKLKEGRKKKQVRIPALYDLETEDLLVSFSRAEEE